MRDFLTRVIVVAGVAGAFALPACGAIVSTDGYAGPPLVDAGTEASTTDGSTMCSFDLQNDADHCGTCDHACPSSQVCDHGACSDTCANGATVCNRACIDTNSDPKNCGGCLRACPVPASATATCALGQCGFTCNTGTDDCDKDAANGCETNLTNDVANCGKCGTACPGGADATAACTNSACGLTCADGFGDCDKLASTGCEVDLHNNNTNCGACGNDCTVAPNATATCHGLACQIDDCTGSFKDCDKKESNGCETTAANDPKNCGDCNVVCPDVTNGVPGCTGTTCGIGSCDNGFDNCDGNPTNGCEAALTNDDAHCGTCGNVCGGIAQGTSKCSGTSCVVATCDSPFLDCDNSLTNGCETNIHTTANCGACNKVCAPPNAQPDCGTGTCEIAGCNGGFGDCDGVATNGCETATTASAGACGGCGAVCSAGMICSGSACVAPPPAGGTCTSGCSCTTQGTCSRACPSGGCAFTCDIQANCTFDCDAGGCTLTQDTQSTTTMSCKGGGCTVNPAIQSTLVLDCDGGGCTVNNTGSQGSVTVHCAGGNCKVNCGSSQHCTIDQCTPGHCEADCTAIASTCTIADCTKNCTTDCNGAGTSCTNSCTDVAQGCTF